jgi:DNA-binding Lrp family transcriptional regulator
MQMLKKIDLEILKHLRKDARKSLADISRETGAPISTVFDKLNRFESSLINKHVSLLNFPALGHSLKVNYLIKCRDRDKVKDFLFNHKNINTLYRINNGSDFLVEAIFKDMNEMEEFSEALDELSIYKAERYHVIEELRKEDFMVGNNGKKD